ncbi:MAG: flavodoxin-dependent (E)-4-hydroxy-3-methylbut-2-enyl-diphosphate synthase [Candidatus Syntrophonatronum acetioxidans]|uniref:4-hydroxy-3-methylbut-2-en-1-yl diphosphate synthase (flavodoxin) n=1 Tax=Candidatus Syntrophonatronum acetioxidans TaxID=1795816 RepID=A0A424YEC0_9FIRM|nr:MAG: flavodoxin-dependent (E)-4-hydroxy-3-methylbut-2-enyl-diphosphate synthase [Candidatus Syntrophonatronum acetioxidans]
MKRENTKKIKVGNVNIGGGSPVSIQSMTNTDTRNTRATVNQIKKLEKLGCELVRVAVPDMEAANKLSEIKGKINIPLIADIHFNYRLALKAIEEGVDKIRINPGNIGNKDRVSAIVRAAAEKSIPIRIGVNAGSIEKRLLEKYGGPTSEALVQSALDQVSLLEELNFDNIIVSLKASNVKTMIDAYTLFSGKTSYPLHLGVTEGGTLMRASVKSSVGIGCLLLRGIGDTLRVSITGDPREEIMVAREILRAAGLRDIGPDIISCPTCGRCEIDLISMVQEIEEKVKFIKYPLKIAIMGCVVNGPGEAREADIGIAGGKGTGVLFKRGKVLKRVPEEKMVEEFLIEIDNHLKELGFQDSLLTSGFLPETEAF